MTTQTPRRRRSDGERSRRAILEAAARLATVEGLNGLTIGRLADETGMSKSGLFAHFGSKEQLQLATIETAEDIFEDEVLRPALEAEGLARVEALCERFLSHVERGVFPGGCFFVSASVEFGPRTGPVHDAMGGAQKRWVGLLEGHRGGLLIEDGPSIGCFDDAIERDERRFDELPHGSSLTDAA